MDTFFEQLITIKKTVKTWIAYFGIALAAIIIMTAAYLFLRALFIVIAALTLYGAYKLYSMLSVEYEYIITNSTMDIDKIIAKNSRKRIFSFELPEVQRVEKYSHALPADVIKDAFFACNSTDENAYAVVIQTAGKGRRTVVIAPNERMVEAMKKFLPKHITENLK